MSDDIEIVTSTLAAGHNDLNNHKIFDYVDFNDATTGSTYGFIRFQNGPITEVGVNGVTNEDLLEMVIKRLGQMNKVSPARENSIALTNLEQGLMWLERLVVKRKPKDDHS